ncbi:MAG: hypothetical protein RR632_07640 [Christensenella sp.]
MACLTEDGRVLEFSPDPKVRTLELINGVWSKPIRPVSVDEEFNARVLSVEELNSYAEKFGNLR